MVPQLPDTLPDTQFSAVTTPPQTLKDFLDTISDNRPFTRSQQVFSEATEAPPGRPFERLPQDDEIDPRGDSDVHDGSDHQDVDPMMGPTKRRMFYYVCCSSVILYIIVHMFVVCRTPKYEPRVRVRVRARLRSGTSQTYRLLLYSPPKHPHLFVVPQ